MGAALSGAAVGGDRGRVESSPDDERTLQGRKGSPRIANKAHGTGYQKPRAAYEVAEEGTARRRLSAMLLLRLATGFYDPYYQSQDIEHGN